MSKDKKTTEKETKKTPAKKKATKKKAAPKKREVTNNTEVKVYNNRLHPVSFGLAGGNRVVLGRLGQYREVRVEDLEVLLSNAPAMLTEGSLIIKDKDVREFLKIDKFYNDGNIVDSKKIDEILEEDVDKLNEILKEASDAAIDEIFSVAQERVEELTIGKISVIEQYAGMKLIVDY